MSTSLFQTIVAAGMTVTMLASTLSACGTQVATSTEEAQAQTGALLDPELGCFMPYSPTDPIFNNSADWTEDTGPTTSFQLIDSEDTMGNSAADGPIDMPVCVKDPCNPGKWISGTTVINALDLDENIVTEDAGLKAFASFLWSYGKPALKSLGIGLIWAARKTGGLAIKFGEKASYVWSNGGKTCALKVWTGTKWFTKELTFAVIADLIVTHVILKKTLHDAVDALPAGELKKALTSAAKSADVLSDFLTGSICNYSDEATKACIAPGNPGGVVINGQKWIGVGLRDTDPVAGRDEARARVLLLVGVHAGIVDSGLRLAAAANNGNDPIPEPPPP